MRYCVFPASFVSKTFLLIWNYVTWDRNVYKTFAPESESQRNILSLPRNLLSDYLSEAEGIEKQCQFRLSIICFAGDLQTERRHIPRSPRSPCLAGTDINVHHESRLLNLYYCLVGFTKCSIGSNPVYYLAYCWRVAMLTLSCLSCGPNSFLRHPEPIVDCSILQFAYRMYKFPAGVVPSKLYLDESDTAFVAQFESGANTHLVPSFGHPNSSALWSTYVYNSRGTESIILVRSF